VNKCIIFDIDGTVADLTHRVHHVQGGKKNWVAFMATLSDDLPIEQTIFLNQLIHTWNGHRHFPMPILFVSGRSENERRDTELWLAKYGLKYDKLLMRPAGDILGQIRAEGYEPWLIFDDRQQVVDMWREEGLFVLQCDPHKNFTAHHCYQFHTDIKYPLVIMVGPSGAGKSTWIEEELGTEGLKATISSDTIRQELCGNFQDQSQNLKVFEVMHELASLRLKRGLPVILDATHLRNADRKKAASLVPNDVPVLYVVIDRPLEEKKLSAGWRSGVTVRGKPLIEYHEQTFKSNIKAILSGDGLPNVAVLDARKL
jgi:hypothetical protein